MPIRFRAPSDPFRELDRHADQLRDRIVPIYRRAMVREARGDDPVEVWDDLRQRLRRGWILMALLGHTLAYRRMRAQGLVPEPEDEGPFGDEMEAFSEGPEDQLVNRAFRLALAQFRGEVPSLEAVIGVLNGKAGAVADAFVAAQRRDAAVVIGTLARRAAIALDATVPPLETLTDEAFARIVKVTGSDPLRSRLDTQVRTATMGAFNTGARDRNRAHANVVPVLMLSEIRDRRTRGNPAGLYPDAGPHYQMDGFAAPTDDPVWDRITPPNGWNCRGSVRGVSIAEARRRRYGTVTDAGDFVVDAIGMRRRYARQWALIESGRYPDEGFG